MKLLTGNEHFTFEDMPINKLLSDFWAWNSSDLLNNTLRGALAEFIVASSLGIDTDNTRKDWEAFDLLYKDICIEVKSSAYLQSWEQEKPSKIQFGISPSRSWTSEQNYDDEVKRHSDVYVFALFICLGRAEANPMILEQWDFYVLPTKLLDEHCSTQKSISLQSLMKLEPIMANYGSLPEAIEEALCR